ncbi:hypothetical protein HRbin36_01061 [bacterium HR36]|nr:hypothetical protein HRbin36_01061 [bacterium HR36]
MLDRGGNHGHPGLCHGEGCARDRSAKNFMRTLNGPSRFTVETFAVSRNNFIVLWGTGKQNQLLMCGPDGIEAEHRSLCTSYGANDVLYVYILGQNEDGSALLVYLELNLQTRLRMHTFPQFRVNDWAVDSEDKARLLGTDAGGLALWWFEPDGRAQGFTFELPRRQELWFYDPPPLMFLSRDSAWSAPLGSVTTQSTSSTNRSIVLQECLHNEAIRKAMAVPMAPIWLLF